MPGPGTPSGVVDQTLRDVGGLLLVMSPLTAPAVAAVHRAWWGVHRA